MTPTKYVEGYISQILAGKGAGLAAPSQKDCGDFYDAVDALWSVRTQSPDAIRGAWEIILRANPTLRKALQKRLYSFDELSAIPTPHYIIDDFPVYPAPLLTLFYGKPGSTKTFVALHVAISAAVAGRTVVYCAGEGISSIYGRYKAWTSHYRQAPTNLYLWDTAINFLDAAEIATFQQHLRDRRIKPDLLVVDTLARALNGINENDAQAMQGFINAVERFAQDSEVGILLIHHSNKGGLDFRGSTALAGAMDAIIHIQRNDGVTAIYNDLDHGAKNKHREEFQPKYFRLLPVGENAVLVPADQVSVDTPLPDQEDQKLADGLREILAALEDDELPVVRITERTKLAKPTVYRRLKRLIQLELITYDGDSKYALTRKGRQALGYVGGGA